MAGHVINMNALPIKNRPSPHVIIDELIADYGLRTVFLTIVSRLVKRTRPPDPRKEARGLSRGELNLFDNHLRRDLGLPPAQEHRLQIDLTQLQQRQPF